MTDTITPPVPVFLEAALKAAPVESGKREVVGLAVPYGEETARPDWFRGTARMRIDKATVAEGAQLFYGHDHLGNGLPIGLITASEQTDAGLKITARISETPKGDEVYTLLLDDVLTKFSIGFLEDAWHVEGEGDDKGSVLVHDNVLVFETSVVPRPQYDTARIESVLHRSTPPHTNPEETHMTDTLVTPEALTALKDGQDALTVSVATIERKISTLGTSGTQDGPPVPVPGRNYGEFLKLVAGGDKAAMDFLAYVGGTTDDLGDVLKDSWVGDRFRTIEAQRTTLNFFARSPLPAEGMGVEYGIVGTDTTKVEEQLAEGDTLAYGKITWDTARAPLRTFGGWGEMTRQEVERSPFNVVERFFGALVNRYAQTTEARVNAAVQAAGTTLTGGVLDLGTADGWTRFVIRAARVLKDKGYPLEALLVGFDVFEDLALLRDGTADDAPRFLNRATGTINVTGLSGEMFNLPVIPIETGVTTDVVRAANSEAIRTYEAAGAPFRLQDDDITNLTKAFSVYGYMADAVEVPEAIVKPQTV